MRRDPQKFNGEVNNKIGHKVREQINPLKKRETMLKRSRERERERGDSR